MYKHVLVLVDGTKLSDKAVKEATGLAGGVGGFLPGGETQKVLTHSWVPVLAVR